MTVLFAVLSQSQIKKFSIHAGYSRFISGTYPTIHKGSDTLRALFFSRIESQFVLV